MVSLIVAGVSFSLFVLHTLTTGFFYYNEITYTTNLFITGGVISTFKRKYFKKNMLGHISKQPTLRVRLDS